jgi:hypothetical protein
MKVGVHAKLTLRELDGHWWSIDDEDTRCGISGRMSSTEQVRIKALQ